MNSKTNPSFNPDTITTSTTPEMPFFVGNPSFGAHHWTHKKRLILFALLYVAVSLYIDLARWWSSKPLTNDTRLLFFLQLFVGNDFKRHRPGTFPSVDGSVCLPRCVSSMVQWSSFIPRDALDPDTCSSLPSLPQPSFLCFRDHRFTDSHGFLD